jgi:hypothetical protein
MDAAADTRLLEAVREAERFFMAKDAVHGALEKLVGLLSAERIPDLGRGYVEKSPGSRGMRDAENGVDIDVVLAGEYPGDGKPKPVAFPDPATATVERARVRLLPLSKLMELKLASGMSAPHRLRDLADVLEIIRLQHLPEDFAAQLDPFVREKFRELWQAAQHADPE